MNNEYDDTLDVINHMAMVKMAMNQHKGKIEDLDPEQILTLLRGEVDELEGAINGAGPSVRVIEEAADCMNFLVAIVHKRIDKYRNRQDKDHD